MLLEFELKAFYLLGSALSFESLHQPFFMLGIFEIESQELSAWADLKL
jgi:hypothetical protein